MKIELPVVEMYMLYPDSKNYPACQRIYYPFVHAQLYSLFRLYFLIIRSPSIISALLDKRSKIKFGIIYTAFFCSERGYRTQHFPS
jgi:hypothetical protein